MTYELTEVSFLKDVAMHEMHLLRDDGVYRHVRFKRPGTVCMHFDLITWPGYLCYCGDMGTFVFTRLLDMFEFFRTDREHLRRRGDRRLGVNLPYWAEKLVAVDGQRRHGSAMEFSEPKLRAYVNETRLQWVRDARRSGLLSQKERRDLWEEVDHEVLSRIDDDGEEAAYIALRDFRWIPKRGHCAPEYEFTDFWEIEFKQYTHRFQWCCYALAWGVEQYDAAREVAVMKAANSEQAASVRLTRAEDGHWYLDVRRATSAAFRSDSRHASLDEALERVRAVAGRDLQRKSAGCVG